MSKHAAKTKASSAAPTDDDLDTNFQQAADFAAGSDSDADPGSGSDDDMPPAKAAVKKEAPKADTSKPPVRAPAVPQKLAKSKPGEAPKQLTKQQLNQIAAREKQKAAAAAAAASAAASSAPAAAAAKPQGDKKRKAPAAADSDSSDSDDSSSDSDDEPSAKAVKASAAATPAAAAAAAKKQPGSNLVDTTGMTEKEAKAAIIEAKRAARKLKKEKRAAEIAAAGPSHPSQQDLQLMTRDNAARKLWELFEQDRRERGQALTAVEADQIGVLEPQSLAQLPNHDKLDGHSFKQLYKALKSMYGEGYNAQVCGGTIQPALSTKADKLAKKRDRAERKEAGDEKVADEEDEEIKQKQHHIDDPTIGAPYIVFITGSAIRAVEIGRAFKKIPMNTRVVKLFAKHIKFDEQREELSHDVRVVIGTPHRLLRLSQAGFLKWNRARLVLWDIGKTRKLQVAEMQQRRRNKNKVKKGIDVENPLLGELTDEQKGKDAKMYTLVTLKDTKSQLWQLYEQYMADVLVKQKTAKLVLL